VRPLSWEEKFEAMKELCGDFAICLRMRQPGDWYVSATGRHVASDRPGDGQSSVYGNGKTPEEAVTDDWRKLVERLPNGYFITVQTGSLIRRLRWTGSFWKDVRPPERAP